jgi:hypothetical protein
MEIEKKNSFPLTPSSSLEEDKIEKQRSSLGIALRPKSTNPPSSSLGSMPSSQELMEVGESSKSERGESDTKISTNITSTKGSVARSSLSLISCDYGSESSSD